MNKKPLQATTAFLGLIPLLTGIISMLGVKDPIMPRREFRHFLCSIATCDFSAAFGLASVLPYFG